MSKAKKTNLDALSKQIEALIAKRDSEIQRMKKVVAEGIMTDELILKLSDYSNADLKKLGNMLASKVDDCIAQLEREKNAKKVVNQPAPQPAEEPNVQNGNSAYRFVQQQ